MICNGPSDASILLIGETVGPDEIKHQKPFAGSSGWTLKTMLSECGIDFEKCFSMNMTDVPGTAYFLKATKGKEQGIERLMGKYPSPQLSDGCFRIRKKIKELKPNVIIPLGKYALWGLTGEDTITKWRGSMLEFEGIPVVPTFNPAAVGKNWPYRWDCLQDFKRAFELSLTGKIDYPKRNFTIKPTYEEAMTWLNSIPDGDIVCDIETLANNRIDCIGFAISKNDCICIPFYNSIEQENYFTLDEEVSIVKKIASLAKEPRLNWYFHNCLFDTYMIIRDFGFTFKNINDTMIMHHLCTPGKPKSLNHCASTYCDYYRYWKDDSKKAKRIKDIELRWRYNCQDCAYTYEVKEALQGFIKYLGLSKQYKFQMRFTKTLMNMMLRGVKIDTEYKNTLKTELLLATKSRMEWFEVVLGHDLNPESHTQTQALLYDDFKVKPIIDWKTRKRTADDDALEEIKDTNPLLSPLVEVIQEVRSLGKFKSNYAEAKLDSDDRMRCSFNPTGAVTYRCPSSKSPLDTGANLQTIPKGTED